MSKTEDKQKKSEMNQRFMEHKLLSEGIQTEITNVRIDQDDKPLIILDSTERGSYTVQLDRIHDPNNGHDLVNLYRMFTVNPNADISELVGRTVTISYSNNGEDRLNIRCNGTSVDGTIREDTEYCKHSSELTEDQETSLILGYNNESTNGSITSYQIEDVNIKDSTLEIVTQEFTKEFNEEYSYSEDQQTPYERLIDYAGSGSIQNLEGSTIYVVSKENIYSKSDDFHIDKLPLSWSTVCETEDDKIIFASKPSNDKLLQSKLVSKITPGGFGITMLTLLSMLLINIWVILTYSESEISIFTFLLILSPIIPALLMVILSRGYFID